ncbi:hypothetical protein BDZ45DRAFT_748247 [Acephala macrosclerotiorum]|nr:hypothetical protein BDZ45DRAFT_748247 [Acephala macrosclerotiorum]
MPAFASHATNNLMDGGALQSLFPPSSSIRSRGRLSPVQLSSKPQRRPQQHHFYTPSSLGRQVVLTFSKANRIYSLDAVNGSLIASQDLSTEGEGPFIVSDLPSCNDISQTIRITSTPVIDPSVDTVYFWAKGYLAHGQSGWQNAGYRFYAIDAATLKERSGFLTNIQGAMADNDNTRRFTASALIVTEWVIGMSTSRKFVTAYATVGGAGTPAQVGTWNGGGGAAGVWMAGSAVASDNFWTSFRRYDSAAGAVGVGPATITALNGQSGTAILWICDTNGVRVYHAVPVNGQMVEIPLLAMGGLTKFSRVAFGDGRYCLTTSGGSIFGFGAPVAAPLNCTSPGLILSNPMYQAQDSSLPTGSLSSGASFSFPVTLNLTNHVLNSGITNSPSVSPGVLSSALTSITTTSKDSRYSSEQSISLTGKAVVKGPFLSISPLQVTFPGIVNTGKSALNLLGYAFSTKSDGPYNSVKVSSAANLDNNGTFTSQDLPALGTIIPIISSVTVTASFPRRQPLHHTHNLLKRWHPICHPLRQCINLPDRLLEQLTNEEDWITVPDCTPSSTCPSQINIGSPAPAPLHKQFVSTRVVQTSRSRS